MQSGKPIALYEKLLFNVLFSMLVVLGLLSIVGVKWNAWIGLAGLILEKPGDEKFGNNTKYPSSNFPV